jgi:cytochrome P450
MRNSLMVADAEALKDILVRDFHHFMDRREFSKAPFVSKFLTRMQGQEWKQTRSIMSPTFTSGKMKAMFPLMNMSLETLVKVYEKSNGGDIDALNTFANFTMDVIAKVAFAVETNTHDGENCSTFKA